MEFLGSVISDQTDLPAELKEEPSHLAQLLGLIREVDLVIDASASSEVQHALSGLASV